MIKQAPLLCCDHLDADQLKFALISTSILWSVITSDFSQSQEDCPTDGASFASVTLLQPAMKMRRMKKTPVFFNCHVCTEEPERTKQPTTSIISLVSSGLLCSKHLDRYISVEVITSSSSVSRTRIWTWTCLTLLSRTRLCVGPLSSSRVSAEAAFKVSGSRRPRHPAESPLRQKMVKGTEEWTARWKTANNEHSAVLLWKV